MVVKHKSWPVIEYDCNDSYPRDLVTTDCAEDIKVGDELIAVCLDHISASAEATWKVLDWGNAILCRCTGKSQSQTDGLWLITAEPIEALVEASTQ